MKRFLITSALLFLIHVISTAQIIGGFSIGQDGHIYFQAQNQTMYTFQTTIVATSSDRENSEGMILYPGSGFYLGPTTPWKWYWKQGDKISINYINGQSQTWICPQSDQAYSRISFKGKHCSGTVGCKCSGFAPKTDGDVWEQAFCRRCGHHRKYHK